MALAKCLAVIMFLVLDSRIALPAGFVRPDGGSYDRLAGLDIGSRKLLQRKTSDYTFSGERDFQDQLISESIAPAHFIQEAADVMQLADGGWLVAFSDDRQGNARIYWQRFDASGVVVGENVEIAGSVVGSDYVEPRLATDTLGRIYLYCRDRTGGLILGHRFDADLNADLAQFLVNDTTGDAFAGPFDLAVFPDGQSVVAWEDFSAGSANIVFRMYAPSGTSLIGPDSVNSGGTGSQQSWPVVAVAPGSGFVVAWEDHRNGRADIYARQFTGAGSPVAAEFSLVPPPNDAASQFTPDIVYSSLDRYVIGWIDRRQGQEIYLQRFDQSIGLVAGNQLISSGDTLISNTDLDLGVDASGKVCAVWADFGATNRILAQRFDSALIAGGLPMARNSDSLGGRWGPAVDFNSISNSAFVWTEFRAEQTDISLTLLDSLNNPLIGSELLVNDDTAGASSNSPCITQGGLWNDLVSYVDRRHDAGDIYIRAINVVGLLGAEQLINQDSVGNLQSQPAAASSASKALVVWNDSRSVAGFSGQRIYGRFTNLMGTPAGPEFMISDSTSLAVKLTPRVVSTSDGRMLVGWIDRRDGTAQVYGMWLAVDGSLDGNEFLVSQPAVDSSATDLCLGLDSSDNFYIVWLDRGLGEPEVKLKWYSRDLAGEGSLSWPSGVVGTPIDEMAADITPDSLVAIFWTGETAGEKSGYLVLLHADGSESVPAFSILDAGAEPTDPDIAVSENGYVVCTWVDRRSGQLSIYKQVLNSSLVALGANEPVASANPNYMVQPSVDARRGRAWFAWSDPRSNGLNVYATMATYNATSVDDPPPENLPARFTLEQNFPNPFNPETAISFVPPRSGMTTLEVFNVLGQHIRSLTNQSYQAGRHTLIWDSTDERGRPMASGIYFYRLVFEEIAQTRKMILLR